MLSPKNAKKFKNPQLYQSRKIQTNTKHFYREKTINEFINNLQRCGFYYNAGTIITFRRVLRWLERFSLEPKHYTVVRRTELLFIDFESVKARL